MDNSPASAAMSIKSLFPQMSGLILEIMKILVDLGKNLEVYGFT